MENVMLKSFNVFEEDGMHFAHIVYRYEDEKGLWELTVPKLRIPLELDSFKIKTDTAGGPIDIDFGKWRMYPVDEDIYAKNVLIEEKIHNMTVEEIEEKLGYRVRIVKGEDKNGRIKG